MASRESEREGGERKRKLKFSARELQVLVEEVVKHHTKLFGKQSLQVAEAEKRRIWLGIHAQVNAIGVTPRDIDVLKKRWYDLRIITKKKLAEQRKQASQTGGGRSRAAALTDLEQLVESTIEPESVTGIGDADSSARAATKQGESSRRTVQEKEGRAARKGREDASTSAGHTTPPPPASPPPPAAQPEPASPQLSASPAATPPAVGRPRRHAVATLQAMDSSSEDTRGPDTQTAPLQETSEGAHTGARRRRARDRSPTHQGDGVFAGLEASMVKVQRLQGKAIQSVQRQMRHLNQNMVNIDRGISSMAEGLKEMAEGMQDMSQFVLLLCSKLDEDRATRRRERQKMEHHTRAVNRLATATSLLCRRSVAMQEGLAHCCTDVSRVMVKVTSALEVLLTTQSANAGALDVGESEETTSRSSITPLYRTHGGAAGGMGLPMAQQPVRRALLGVGADVNAAHTLWTT